MLRRAMPREREGRAATRPPPAARTSRAIREMRALLPPVPARLPRSTRTATAQARPSPQSAQAPTARPTGLMARPLPSSPNPSAAPRQCLATPGIPYQLDNGDTFSWPPVPHGEATGWRDRPPKALDTVSGAPGTAQTRSVATPPRMPSQTLTHRPRLQAALDRCLSSGGIIRLACEATTRSPFQAQSVGSRTLRSCAVPTRTIKPRGVYARPISIDHNSRKGGTRGRRGPPSSGAHQKAPAGA